MNRLIDKYIDRYTDRYIDRYFLCDFFEKHSNILYPPILEGGSVLKNNLHFIFYRPYAFLSFPIYN